VAKRQRTEQRGNFALVNTAVFFEKHTAATFLKKAIAPCEKICYNLL